jgi:phenylpyruvate tautomerase PptA (4-oxalocrotonate tautomerase family)
VPLVRIALSQHLTDTQVAHISNAVHDAMVATFNVPPKDRFQVITRHPPGELIYAPDYLDITHGDTFAMIQITCNEGRTLEMKKALFAAIAESVARGGAVPAADVFVNLVEVKKENWSFGNGIAQYAT